MKKRELESLGQEIVNLSRAITEQDVGKDIAMQNLQIKAFELLRDSVNLNNQKLGHAEKIAGLKHILTDLKNTQQELKNLATPTLDYSKLATVNKNVAHQQDILQHRLIEINGLLKKGVNLTESQKSMVKVALKLQDSDEPNLGVWKKVNNALYDIKENMKAAYSNFAAEPVKNSTVKLSQHRQQSNENKVDAPRSEGAASSPRVSRILAEKSKREKLEQLDQKGPPKKTLPQPVESTSYKPGRS